MADTTLVTRFSEESLEAFIVRRERSGWALTNRFIWPISAKEFLESEKPLKIPELDDLLAGKNPVSILLWPPERSLSHFFWLPPLLKAELALAAENEMDGLIPWPIEQCQTALMIRREQSSCRVFAVSTPRAPLETAIRKLADHQLEPKHIFPESVILYEKIPSAPKSSSKEMAKECTIYTQEEKKAVLGLICQANFPRQEFVLREEGVESRDRALSNVFFALAAEGFSPERGTLPAPSLSGSPGPDFSFITRMLAFVFPNGTLKRDIPDFRVGKLASTHEKKQLYHQMKSLSILAGVILLAALLDGVVHYDHITKQMNNEEGLLTAIASRTLSPSVVVDPISQMEQKEKSLKEQRALLSRGTDIIELLRAIATAPPEEIPFELVSMSIGAKSLNLSGKTDSFQHVETVRQELLKNPHIKELSVQSARLGIDKKTVTFRMGGLHD